MNKGKRIIVLVNLNKSNVHASKLAHIIAALLIYSTRKWKSKTCLPKSSGLDCMGIWEVLYTVLKKESVYLSQQIWLCSVELQWMHEKKGTTNLKDRPNS